MSCWKCMTSTQTARPSSKVINQLWSYIERNGTHILYACDRLLHWPRGVCTYVYSWFLFTMHAHTIPCCHVLPKVAAAGYGFVSNCSIQTRNYRLELYKSEQLRNNKKSKFLRKFIMHEWPVISCHTHWSGTPLVTIKSLVCSFSKVYKIGN
jgi:hypothetical protein